MKRNSWMLPIRLMWRNGYRWEAISTWFLMHWIFVEAYWLPKQSMRRAMRAIERAKQ